MKDNSVKKCAFWPSMWGPNEKQFVSLMGWEGVLSKDLKETVTSW